MRRLVLAAGAAALAAVLPLTTAAAADGDSGALDTTYGSGGSRTLALPGNELSGLQLVHQGRTTIAAATWTHADGSPQGYDAGVVVQRLGRHGAVDPTFGTRGRRLLDLPTPAFLTDVAVLPKDRILVLMDVAPATPGGPRRVGLARLFPDGARDLTFGDKGIVVSEPGVSDLSPVALVAQPDGRILVGLDQEQPDGDFAVAAYTASGALDPTYGHAGVALVDLGGSDQLNNMLPGRDGSVVAVGTSSSPSGQPVAVVRLTSTGLLDPAFGTGGSTVFPAGEPLAGVSGATIAGRTLVVTGTSGDGESGSSSFVAELSDAGQLRTGFGTGGILRVDEPGQAESAVHPLLTSRGTIVFGQQVGDSPVSARVREVSATTGAAVPGWGSAGVVTLPGEFVVTDLLNDAGGVLLAGTGFDGSGPTPPVVQRRQ